MLMNESFRFKTVDVLMCKMIKPQKPPFLATLSGALFGIFP